MSDVPAHFCPGCGVRQKAFLRYPWHFCNECRKTACDRAGRAFVFGNTSFGGGFEFGYADADERYDCGGVVCLINRRPVYVHEARFGGIVAEPIPDIPFDRRGVIDVRRGIPQSFFDEVDAKRKARKSPRTYRA